MSYRPGLNRVGPETVGTHRRVHLRGRVLSSSAGRRTGWPAQTPTAPRPAAPPPGGSTSLPRSLLTLHPWKKRDRTVYRRVAPSNPDKKRTAVVVFTESADCTSLPGMTHPSTPSALAASLRHARRRSTSTLPEVQYKSCRTLETNKRWQNCLL